MVLDIILGVILVIAFISGYRRGFLRCVWGISALIIAIILTAMLRPYVYDMFTNSVFANKTEEYITARVTEKMEAGTESILSEEGMLNGIYTLPEKYSELATERIENAGGAVTESISSAITQSVLDIASAILLFVVIRLVLAIVYAILNLAFKFPVLRQTNKLAGAVASTLITLTMVYVVFAVVAITGTDIFEQTAICRFLYNNNILLTVIGI